jgi:hypothetical protein
MLLGENDENLKAARGALDPTDRAELDRTVENQKAQLSGRAS